MTAPVRTTLGGVIGAVAAMVGTVIMAFAFVRGIDAALSGDGNGAGGLVALFLLGLVVVVVALVFAIVRLVQKRGRVLAIITILVAAVPLGTILYLSIWP